jgi:hypothetical protein
MTTTKTTTEQNIMAFGKALREVNNMPVYSQENILEIRKITGQDGIVRELIIVDKLATRCVRGYETVSEEVQAFNRGTFDIQPARGHYVGNDYIPGKRSLRSISASLRRGYGINRGIVTDRVNYRYDVSRRGW